MRRSSTAATAAAAAHKAGKTVEQAAADQAWMDKYPGYNSTRALPQPADAAFSVAAALALR